MRTRTGGGVQTRERAREQQGILFHELTIRCGGSPFRLTSMLEYTLATLRRLLSSPLRTCTRVCYTPCPSRAAGREFAFRFVYLSLPHRAR